MSNRQTSENLLETTFCFLLLKIKNQHFRFKASLKIKTDYSIAVAVLGFSNSDSVRALYSRATFFFFFAG